MNTYGIIHVGKSLNCRCAIPAVNVPMKAIIDNKPFDFNIHRKQTPKAQNWKSNLPQHFKNNRKKGRLPHEMIGHRPEQHAGPK